MPEPESLSPDPNAPPAQSAPAKPSKAAPDKPKEATEAEADPKEATEADVVLHYVGKNDVTITTGYGGLPPRDLTRAETRTLIRTKAWLRGVMESGVYEAVEGTLIQLPDTEDAAG